MTYYPAFLPELFSLGEQPKRPGFLSQQDLDENRGFENHQLCDFDQLPDLCETQFPHLYNGDNICLAGVLSRWSPVVKMTAG